VSESGGLESDLGTTDPTSHQRQPKYFQKEFLKALTALGKEKIEIPVDGKAIEAWTKLACDPEKLNKVFPDGQPELPEGLEWNNEGAAYSNAC
jgi:hypothetical protein